MKHQYMFVLIAVALALLVPACAPKATSTEIAPTTQSPTAPGAALDAQPNPLTVKATRDDKLSASAVISTTGGTLSVTGADGTKFTLTLPANALLSDEEITLTPVTSVDGLPLSGGLQAAVQLEPDGLQLFEPAILTIELPKPPASDGFKSIGFAYHGDGQEFHLYPSKVEGSKITFWLSHFSGRGSGKATNADVSKQKRQHSPSAPQDRTNQDLSDVHDPLAAKEFLRPAYLNIDRRLDAARSNPALLGAAMDLFLSWLDTVKQFGLEKEFAGEIEIGWGLIAEAVVNAANQASQDCINKNDPTQIERLLRWIKLANYLKRYVGADVLANLEGKLRKCATFELTFDSTLVESIDTEVGYAEFASHVRAKVPVQFSSAPNTFEAKATLEYVSFTPTWKFKISGLTCKYGQPQLTNGEFRVLSPTLNSATERLDLRLYIDPGQEDNARIPFVRCEADGVSTEVPMEESPIKFHQFSDFFYDFHVEEFAQVGYLIYDWERGDGNVFARKTYQRPITCPGPVTAGIARQCTESTLLELTHKPQK